MSEAVATHQEQTSVPFPRPQMERQAWISLDGTWDFCSGRETSYSAPGPVQWNQKIIVPFSPKTPASGIGDTGFYSTVWSAAHSNGQSSAPGTDLFFTLKQWITVQPCGSTGRN